MNRTKFLAPIYLQNFVTYDNEKYFEKIEERIEWRGQLKSSAENIKFRIRFYGELYEKWITGTDFSQALIIAEDIETKEEIILFDGCKHGYNAMFCDSFSDEQLKNRPVDKIYRDKNENDVFEVILKVYHGINYDEEMEDFVNEEGKIELLSKEIISEEELKRNGFDYLEINVFNSQGKKIEIVSVELA